MTTKEKYQLILKYEIHASWWACHLKSPRLRDLAADYFIWKVGRKMRRWAKNRKLI